MFVLAAGLLLLLAAAAVTVRAWVPVREGFTPHCRRCDYILSGLAAGADARCPECGLVLTRRNIFHGDRLPNLRPRLVAAALLASALLLIVLGLTHPLRSVNWYGFKPTAWVLRDFESSAGALQQRAWDELVDRRTRHGLSSEQASALDSAVVRLFSSGAATLPAAAIDHLFARFPTLTADQQGAVVGRLLSDLTSNHSRAFAAARQQLESMHGQLSPAHHALLTQAALRVQAANKKDVALEWLLDYLGQREMAGQLTSAERDQFFRACFRPELHVRRRVAAGEDLPYVVRFTGRGPRQLWLTRGELLATRIDDQAARPRGGATSGYRFNAGGPGASLRPDRPGEHTLSVEAELSVFDPWLGDHSPPRWLGRVSLSGPFEVVAGDAPPTFRWIEDPGMADRIRQAIRLPLARASATAPDAFSATLYAEPPPVDVAFEILVRTGGKEYPAGQFHAPAGQPVPPTAINAHRFPPGPNVGAVDVIFRGSEAVAKSTTDLQQAWRGEIVYQNVPVISVP